MHPVILIFVVAVVLKWAFELALNLVNARHVQQLSGSVPEAYREFVDEESYRRSVDYTLAKSRFSMVSSSFDALLLLAVILCGFLPWFFGLLTGVLGAGILGQGCALFAVGVCLAIPGLPLEWWQQFRLEEAYGFNRSSLALWFTDKLKGLAIGFVIGYPLICALLWIVQLPFWWFAAFVLVFVFQLLILVIYPMFIMPLFNKFEALPEGPLRDRLMSLSDRTGFLARTILVMDGSRRSGHSNAFFTGFGRFRRIVLFDTLVEQLSALELESVLAHEIGHYKLGHIPRMLVLSAVSTLAGFWVLGLLVESAWFYNAFGFSSGGGLAPALLLFSLLSGLVTFWLTPAMNLWHRKHEFEADAFARRAMESVEPLIGSLRKLHQENLSNLTPHPFYSRFYYSHPTLLERERSLHKAD
jgi:STE24 endopeptidase